MPQALVGTAQGVRREAGDRHRVVSGFTVVAGKDGMAVQRLPDAVGGN